MNKILITLLSIIAVVFIIILLLPNHFAEISKAEYQKYNSVKEEYGEVVSIEDKDKLKGLTKSLNKATYEKAEYELETSHDIKATLYYENEETEIIYFWLDFGLESTLFQVENREGTFNLKNNKARKELLQIFSY